MPAAVFTILQLLGLCAARGCESVAQKPRGGALCSKKWYRQRRGIILKVIYGFFSPADRWLYTSWRKVFSLFFHMRFFSYFSPLGFAQLIHQLSFYPQVLYIYVMYLTKDGWSC
jgi:hypothetical protein